jgi:hypothetical protein
VTNDLGHRLAAAAADQETLGAYRRGNRMPWVPGATIDVWVPCPRSEAATGVDAPHVYFVQTIGGRTAADGSIHCQTCRDELAARRSAGAVPGTAPVPSSGAACASPPLPQSSLPF